MNSPEVGPRRNPNMGSLEHCREHLHVQGQYEHVPTAKQLEITIENNRNPAIKTEKYGSCQIIVQ